MGDRLDPEPLHGDAVRARRLPDRHRRRAGVGGRHPHRRRLAGGLENGIGRARAVTVAPRLEVNDAIAALAAAEAGEGITQALSYMVAAMLKEGTLVTVLDAIMPPAVPVHLVHGQDRLMAPRLRAFLDFATPRLARALELLSVPRATW
ncbi:MAG: hypothetical protein GC150_08935 [Rhizobiales bacterium]|nr:hypothetical protein [Hyphomicrobiales bacterium]